MIYSVNIPESVCFHLNGEAKQQSAPEEALSRTAARDEAVTSSLGCEGPITSVLFDEDALSWDRTQNLGVIRYSRQVFRIDDRD